MSQTPILPAPRIDLPQAGKWEREHAAFQRLLPSLLSTHRGQYVVIHEGQVFDSGPDSLELAMRFLKQHPVPVHIGLVTDEPEPALRIPVYREIKRSGA